MTLTSSVNKLSYDGDDATASFPITFIFWDETDIKAILRDSAGVETTWVNGTQYNLSGGNGTTGTLTVDTSPTDYTPATGETLIIKSIRSDTQDVDLITGDAFPSVSVEEGMDKIVRLVQQRGEEVDRSLKLGESTPTDGTSLTVPEPSADKLIGWNSAGDDLANIEVGDVTAFGDILFTSKATGDMIRFDGTNWVNRTAAETVSDLSVPSLTVANTFTKTQTFTKGSDVSSANPLVLGDGNQFDVTGTTGFASITTKAAGTTVVLHFDAAVIMTHSAADLVLPGAGNVTTAAGDEFIFHEYATGDWRCVGYALATGKAIVETASTPEVVQMVNTQDGAVATGTTSIPVDDTIPQNTEGDEYMTLAITPTSATNKLKIEVVLFYAHTVVDNFTAALFQDSTAGALAAGGTNPKTINVLNTIVFTHWMTSGTTSATTFKVRAGGNTGATTTINGQAGARRYGGVSASSITISEITN